MCYSSRDGHTQLLSSWQADPHAHDAGLTCSVPTLRSAGPAGVQSMELIAGRLHYADGQALQRLLDGGRSGLTMRLDPGAARLPLTSACRRKPVSSNGLCYPARALYSSGGLSTVALFVLATPSRCLSMKQAARRADSLEQYLYLRAG